MWIVRLALNRPYTFIVLALLILLLSPAVILRTPTDIFPNINIPVISVAWTYTGLNPEDIETRLTTPYEKSAVQRGPSGWPPRYAGHDSQSRNGIDSGCRLRNQAVAAARCIDSARGDEDHPPCRSIGLRAQRHQRRDPRPIRSLRSYLLFRPALRAVPGITRPK
jgi:hypothetical protein